MDIDLEDEDRSVTGNTEKKENQPDDKFSRLKDADRFAIALKKFRDKNKKQFYPEIIDLLQPYVEKHPDHHTAMKMLAFALAETGFWKDSKFYFKKVLHMNKSDPEALNAIAFLDLESGSAEDSIQHLLDAIYVDENNSLLKENLEKLRNIREPKLFFSMTQPADFIYLNLPRESLSQRILDRAAVLLKSGTGKIVLILGAIVVGIFLIYLVYPFYINWLEDYRARRGIAFGQINRISIKDIDKLIDERIKYSVKLTDEQIKQKFDLIKNNIEEKKRNRAVMLINELLNSNAEELIKERVLMLKEFVPDPDPLNIDFTPDVRDVVKVPFLYQDVSVRWNGTVANLEFKGREETVFDLLINFVDEATVEGIAEYHFKGFQKVRNGGKIAAFGNITGLTIDNKIIIVGTDLQDIGK